MHSLEAATIARTQPDTNEKKTYPPPESPGGMGLIAGLLFFLANASGGLYLVSIYIDSTLGMGISLLFAVITLGYCMAHIAKPLHFWRIITQPGASWISRGFSFFTIFIISTAIQLILTFAAPGAEGTFKMISLILAFGIGMYGSYAVDYVNGVKPVNSFVLPLMYLAAGLVSGLGISVFIYVFLHPLVAETLGNLLTLVLMIYAILVALNLWIISYKEQITKDSVKQIISGKASAPFWGIMAVLGFLIPLFVLLFFSYQPAALTIAAICVVIGTLSLRYVIQRAGLATPLDSPIEKGYLK